MAASSPSRHRPAWAPAAEAVVWTAPAPIRLTAPPEDNDPRATRLPSGSPDDGQCHSLEMFKMYDWFPLVFFPFKIIVLGTGMFFAIKWHHDQAKKEKAKKNSEAGGS